MLCGAAPASASAPPLVGAAIHPLWASSTPADYDRELDKLVAGGANAVRVDIGWSTLEADGKGVRSGWYVDKADTFFAHARARGIKVIVNFWLSPCWASSAPADVKQNCAGEWWNRGVDRYPPTDARDFADAAAWVAARWGDDVEALEVWDEPNDSHFFVSTNQVDDYWSLLKATYPKVKAAAPSVKVLAPAVLFSDRYFLARLYDRGMQAYEDGISLHPFSGPRSPFDTSSSTRTSFVAGVPDVRQLMIDRGDGAKKLWFTELGWASCAPGGSHPWCVTQAAQAQYIGDALRIIRDRWSYVQAALVYNLRNKFTDPNSLDAQWGLLNNDFSPKPSWGAFTDALTDLAAHPEPPPAAPAEAPPPAGPTDSGPRPPATRPAPRVSALSLAPATLRSRAARLVVRFRLSDPARVQLRVERREHAGWRRLRTVARAAPAGANRLTLRPRLAPGAYRIVVVAAAVDGSRGAPRSARFRVARAR